MRAQDDSTFWINQDYAQLVGAEPFEQKVTLNKEAVLHLLLTMSFPTFGILTPQTVNAFETWTGENGQRWYHIHTCAGDMWVQSDEQT